MLKGATGSYFRCLWVLAIFPLLCGRAPAQLTISGEITGTVQDSSGAVIPDASITLMDESTAAARTITSSSSGEFVFTAVPHGTYTIKVMKTGFRTYERTSIELSVSQRVALGNIRLAIGQVAQSIEVTAQSEEVNTESADTVASLSSIQVNDLGVKGRDAMQLLRILPGVTTLTVVPWGELSDTDPAGTGANGGQFGSFTPAIGGARMFWNTATIDGLVASNPDFAGLFMAPTSMDAVTEVKVVSNNYTADYGRNPGATIAIITKSGTKDFHGAVYGYKRSEKLNANDFFNNRDGLVKPLYRFGTFGFAVGGPVYIPKCIQQKQGEVVLLLFSRKLASQAAMGEEHSHGSYRRGAGGRFLTDLVPSDQRAGCHYRPDHARAIPE